jgi:hypothetical protein
VSAPRPSGRPNVLTAGGAYNGNVSEGYSLVVSVSNDRLLGKRGWPMRERLKRMSIS